MILEIKGIKLNKSTFKKTGDISMEIDKLKNSKRNPFYTKTDEEHTLVEQENRRIDEEISKLTSQYESCWNKILSNKKIQITQNLKSLHNDNIAVFILF